MAVASLVLGIISIVIGVFFGSFGLIGGVIGIVGIILGVQGKKDPAKKEWRQLVLFALSSVRYFALLCMWRASHVLAELQH